MKNVKLSDYLNVVTRCIGCNFCLENSWTGTYHGCPLYDAYEFESYGPKGKNLITRLILSNDKNLTLDKKLTGRIFSCADCGYCDEFCMTGLPLEEIRQALQHHVLKEAKDAEIPSHITRTQNILKKAGNIFGKTEADKFGWLEDKSVLDKKDADVVYFVGCTTLYSQTQIAKPVVRLLKKMNVNFTILSNEKCCGYPFYITGDLEKGVEFTEENISMFKETNAKLVLFNCPGCMKTFLRTYTHYTNKHFPLKAMHIVEFINNFLKERRISLRLNAKITATFHDPCHLGRGLGIYDAPREALKHIENLELVEMPRSREKSYCCGGGLTTTDPKIKDKISTLRLKEAESTHASIVLQACPTCALNFNRAVKKNKSSLEVMDIVEILDKLL